MRIDKNLLALTTPEVNAVLGEPSAIAGDYSLYALLRAIVINKSKRSLSSEEISNAADINYEPVSLPTPEAANAFFKKSGAMLIGTLEKGVEMDRIQSKGWEKLTGKEHVFLSQFAPCVLFRNKRAKRIAAFVQSRVNEFWLQAFECILCRLLTWYFSSEVSSEDKSFFRSIAPGVKDIKPEEAKQSLIGYVEAAASKVDFRTEFLHKKLDGINTALQKSEKSRLSSKIDSLVFTIADLNSRLTASYSDYDKTAALLKALEKGMDKDDNNIFEFFNDHKNIKLVRVDGANIFYEVVDTLDQYDEEQLEEDLESDGSWVNNECSERITRAIREIFLNHKGLLRVGAAFALYDCRRVGVQRGCFNKDGKTMPSPHLDAYGCNGGNDKYYTEYADSGDWELGITQSISATKNLNFGDVTVCSWMARWLENNSEVPCIYVHEDWSDVEEAEGCTLVSINDFIKMMEEHTNEEA